MTWYDHYKLETVDFQQMYGNHSPVAYTGGPNPGTDILQFGTDYSYTTTVTLTFLVAGGTPPTPPTPPPTPTPPKPTKGPTLADVTKWATTPFLPPPAKTARRVNIEAAGRLTTARPTTVYPADKIVQMVTAALAAHAKAFEDK